LGAWLHRLHYSRGKSRFSLPPASTAPHISTDLSPGNFNFRCNYCGITLRDGSRDYHLKKVRITRSIV
jgi:hypothetical protein